MAASVESGHSANEPDTIAGPAFVFAAYDDAQVGGAVVVFSIRDDWTRERRVSDFYSDEQLAVLEGVCEQLGLAELQESYYECALPAEEIRRQLELDPAFDLDLGFAQFVHGGV